jgi:hypothetical protein
VRGQLVALNLSLACTKPAAKLNSYVYGFYATANDPKLKDLLLLTDLVVLGNNFVRMRDRRNLA